MVAFISLYPLALDTAEYVIPDIECRTIAGPKRDIACIFPFRINHAVYHACAYDPHLDHHWCSTNVDENDNHIKGHWGNCAFDCPKQAGKHSERLHQVP